LGFLDRLHCSSIRQWNCVQNQALNGESLAARLRGTACVENTIIVPSVGLNRSVSWPKVCLGGHTTNTSSCWVNRRSKSYVAFALARESFAGMGYRVYYTRAAALSGIWSLARAVAVCGKDC